MARLTRASDGDFDAGSWFTLLHGHAEVHAARSGLDDETANDIAQHAFTVLWERRAAEGREFQADEAERLVRDLASAERRARDVERKHLSLLRLDGARSDRPPSPCPRLARLALASARPTAFEGRLLVAAWCAARLPGVLHDRQFRIFDLVWIAGAPPGTAAELLGISPRAAHDRLARTSDRLDERLLCDLRSAMPASKWEELHVLLVEKARLPPARAVADVAYVGLGLVIHNHALSLRID